MSSKPKPTKFGPRKPPRFRPMQFRFLQFRSATVMAAEAKCWWRNLMEDPTFPKPHYLKRLRIFSVAELDAYDHARPPIKQIKKVFQRALTS